MGDDLIDVNSQWYLAFRKAAWKAIGAMAIQKLAGWAVYQLHARPNETVEMFLRWLSRTGGGLVVLLNLGGRQTTAKEQFLLHMARIFVDHMADTVFNSSKPDTVPDVVKPLVTQSLALSAPTTITEGVNQNHGNAVINRFGKQIVINNPVRRMTKAKKELKMTPEERKHKKKAYMAQKRAEAKQAAGTIQ